MNAITANKNVELSDFTAGFGEGVARSVPFNLLGGKELGGYFKKEGRQGLAFNSGRGFGMAYIPSSIAGTAAAAYFNGKEALEHLSHVISSRLDWFEQIYNSPALQEGVERISPFTYIIDQLF
ncbi:hypothetical protein CMO93_01445 [Candidatus Woesearchaeota archaeon]|nr:hypothetical protein [Candidatus Woesearchaeota archaeon]|tara:strand:- start:2675 stop:3043 length:369 start_codon:yes stop_codon:yes gene_type:complete